jgi:hypothetical protein
VPSVAPCFHAHSLGATCPHCRIRSPMPLLPVSSTLASAIGPVGPCPTPSVVRALAGGGWGRGHNWEARHGALSTWELSSSRPAARRRRRDKVPWAAGGTTDGAHAVSALVVWTSLGPRPRWVPGPTTRWAPGTTRLALHDI